MSLTVTSCKIFFSRYTNIEQFHLGTTFSKYPWKHNCISLQHMDKTIKTTTKRITNLDKCKAYICIFLRYCLPPSAQHCQLRKFYLQIQNLLGSNLVNFYVFLIRYNKILHQYNIFPHSTSVFGIVSSTGTYQDSILRAAILPRACKNFLNS